MRQFMGLPLLPESQIITAYNTIIEKCKKTLYYNTCTEFIRYFKQTWLLNTSYPIQMWCVYKKQHRTNNGVEG